MISTNRILPLVCALLALGLALAVVPDTRAEELGYYRDGRVTQEGSRLLNSDDGETTG